MHAQLALTADNHPMLGIVLDSRLRASFSLQSAGCERLTADMEALACHMLNTLGKESNIASVYRMIPLRNALSSEMCGRRRSTC